jgi:hypothetical protein
LDVALLTGKMVVVEGNAGIGKTTAADAWVQLHLGECRRVSLSGVSNKTSVFRAISQSLGLASSYAHTATDMQARIEDVLRRSGLMLVIDEAHHLFNAAERVYTRPELVDWINTSLYNHNVPVGLIVTPQFRIRMARVERQTSWNADQLRRRVKRFCQLPAKPRTVDLENVTRKLLPGASKEQLDYIVGYSLSSKLHLPAIVDAIDEARLLARREGREQITFEDVERAIRDFCAQSAQAWAAPIPDAASPRQRTRTRPFRAALDSVPSAAAGAIPLRPDPPAALHREVNLTGLKPAPISASRHSPAPVARLHCGATADA